MVSSSKRKGDLAELEVQGLLRDLLGVPARRMLGAGRKDDVGDMAGVPDTCIQIANWSDVLRAVREKPIEAEQQRQRGNKTFVATFVRMRGGVWRVVQTPEQWATSWREGAA